MTNRLRRICLHLCLFTAALQPLRAEAVAAEFSAPQVKAAFLYNFAKFVDWPAGAFATERSPLVLGVLGQDPVGDAATELLAGKTVKGRPLEIRSVSSPEEAIRCHLLFISSTELSLLDRTLPALQRHSVLTVSDGERFAELGGVIGLMTVDQRIRFEINAQAARDAGLEISSQLLSLATTVHGPPGRARP